VFINQNYPECYKLQRPPVTSVLEIEIKVLSTTPPNIGLFYNFAFTNFALKLIKRVQKLFKGSA